MNPLTDINAINIKQNKTKQNCEHIYMELTHDRTKYIIYTYITMNDTDQTHKAHTIGPHEWAMECFLGVP